jgi:hypothetical protein
MRYQRKRAIATSPATCSIAKASAFRLATGAERAPGTRDDGMVGQGT